MFRSLICSLLVLGGLTGLLCGYQSAGSFEHGREGEQSLELYRPHWQVGQSWTVETRTPRLQIGADPEPAKRESVVRWQFRVEKIEKLGDEQCYVISATPQGVRPAGLQVQLWISVDDLALRQWEASVVASGRLVSSGETLTGRETPIYPAWIPFSVLPIAFPVWQELPVKHAQAYRYYAMPVNPHVKTGGDVSFLIPIEQQSDFSEEEFTKSALGLSPDQPCPAGVVRVELRSPFGFCQQLWQAGQPWPVWATNGVSVSRLVDDE